MLNLWNLNFFFSKLCPSSTSFFNWFPTSIRTSQGPITVIPYSTGCVPMPRSTILSPPVASIGYTPCLLSSLFSRSLLASASKKGSLPCSHSHLSSPHLSNVSSQIDNFYPLPHFPTPIHFS